MRFASILLLGYLSTRFDLSHSEVCLCDSSLACDILCCCDPDCSDDDKARFTCETIAQTTPENADVTCVSKNIFSRISPDDSFSFLPVDHDNCFTSTKSSASSSLTKSVRKKSSSIDSQNTLVPITYTSSFRGISSKNETILKANDLLYIRDGLISSPLVLPASLKGHCVQDSVLFLRNSSSSCSFKITTDNCMEGSKIDSLIYSDWNIVKNFRKSVNETLIVKTVCLDKNGNSLDPCLGPVINGGACDNVVTEIELAVSYGKEDSGLEINNNVSLGIISAELKLKLESGLKIDSSVSLSTTVRFDGNSQDYPNVGQRYRRYKPGYELLFDVKGEKVSFSPFQEDSECTTHLLTFPVSSIQYCVKKISGFSTTNFTQLTESLFDPLPSALAKYHNSDLANPDEWIKLSWKIPKVVESSSTPMNLILTVAHRSYGNKLNPENEILTATTSVSNTNLEYLEKELLVKEELAFYFTLRFVSVDVKSSKDNNIISKLSRSLSNYFSYQTDSIPLQLFAIAVVVFVLLTLAILVNDQGKPQF